MRNNRPVGAVGCVVRWRGKRYLTTAAHVVHGQGTEFDVHGLGPVGVVRVIEDRSADLALLDPHLDLPDTACLLPDNTRITGLSLAPAPGHAVLFRRGHRSATQTTVDRILDSPQLSHGPLICTPIVTQRGDSGTILLDGNLRAVATLVGERAWFDCFLPLSPLLKLLDLELET